MGPRPGVQPAGRSDAEPAGFIVLADGDVRLHFHDWGGRSPTTGLAGALLLPGLLQPAWSWAPVARRLASRDADGGRRPARPGPVRRADGGLRPRDAGRRRGRGRGGLRPPARRADRAGRARLRGAGRRGGRGGPRRPVCGRRARRRRLGAHRGDDRGRRRRVPARPRRAARGHAVDGRLARRTAGASTRPRGTRTRSGSPGTRSSRRRRATWSAPFAPTWSRPSCARCSRRTRSRRWPRSMRP